MKSVCLSVPVPAVTPAKAGVQSFIFWMPACAGKTGSEAWLRNDEHGQNGNAVIFVLLGIVLFGLLSYTLINSAKMGQGNLTKHQANLAAQEIIAYAQVVEQAYNKLRQRGCSETEISFYSDAITYGTFRKNLYNHPQAPTDRRCHIFYPEGGNITYIQTPSNIEQVSNVKAFFPSAVLSTEELAAYHFIMRGQVQGLGNDNQNDLFVGLVYLKKEVCEAINQQLLGNPTIYSGRLGELNDVYRNPFTLDGGNDGAVRIGGGGVEQSAQLRGVKAACTDSYNFSNVSIGKYNFYYVFSVR